MKIESWEPFQKANVFKRDPLIDLVLQKMEQKPEDRPKDIWINNLYQVAVYPPDRVEITQPGWPPMWQLSIKRRDKTPVHDWRHLQRIKNEIIGPEYEALEIYPAESRLVDSANQYFLWVFANKEVRVPFGFTTRFVSNVSEMGAVQRPFPLDAMPSDCESMSQYIKRMQLEKTKSAP